MDKLVKKILNKSQVNKLFSLGREREILCFLVSNKVTQSKEKGEVIPNLQCSTEQVVQLFDPLKQLD